MAKLGPFVFIFVFKYRLTYKILKLEAIHSQNFAYLKINLRAYFFLSNYTAIGILYDYEKTIPGMIFILFFSSFYSIDRPSFAKLTYVYRSIDVPPVETFHVAIIFLNVNMAKLWNELRRRMRRREETKNKDADEANFKGYFDNAVRVIK